MNNLKQIALGAILAIILGLFVVALSDNPTTKVGVSNG
jgi:hypothetical protein